MIMKRTRNNHKHLNKILIWQTVDQPSFGSASRSPRGLLEWFQDLDSQIQVPRFHFHFSLGPGCIGLVSTCRARWSGHQFDAVNFAFLFVNFARKVGQTWFVMHETWHTTLFGIYYCVEMVRIDNNSHMLEIRS